MKRRRRVKKNKVNIKDKITVIKVVQNLPKSRFNPRPYSIHILSIHQLKYDKYKRFWIYDNKLGIWKDQAELILNSILRKKILGNTDYKRYCVGEVIADLKGLTYDSVEPQEPKPHLISFNNGIYDIENDRFTEYSPDYFFINKLPVNFNTKHRKCPTVDRIFNELVAPKDVVTLFEIIAYSFYRAYPYPKLFFLYGSGGNGKTAYTKLIKRILGKDNISLVSCNDLQNNRFASSQLHGKFCNISGEMEYSMLKNTSILKECCGEDLINCERKFKEPFPFTNCAKMIFLTNQVPLTADRSQAFYRRIFLLEFPNVFIVGENADPLIIEKIPQEEIEGLIWKCVQVLKELMGRDFVFSRHENTEKIIKKYERLSNPLVEFLDDYTEKDSDGSIPIKDLKEKFTIFLREKNQRAWTSAKLNSAMNEEGFTQKALAESIEEGQKIYRAWLGIKWKE